MHDEQIRMAKKNRRVQSKQTFYTCLVQNPRHIRFHASLSSKEAQNQQQKKFIELKPTSQGIKLSWKNITLELDPDFDEKTLVRFLNVLR